MLQSRAVSAAVASKLGGRPSLGLGALLLAGLGAGACTHIPPASTESGANGYPVEEVVIEGVEVIDTGPIVSGLANRPPMGWLEGDLFQTRYFRYDELQVELDRRRIASYYERQGYFAVQVDGPRLERVGDKATKHKIIWTVTPGEPAKVRSLVLQNAPEELKPRLEDQTDLPAGTIYTSDAFEAARTRLRALLVREGYSQASVEGEVRVAKDRGAAKVIFDLQPGPLTHIYGLQVEGPKRTPESAVRHRKTWEEGEVFDPVVLEQMRGRLYAIDQYGSVSLDFPDDGVGPDGETDIIARVDEAEQNELQLGVGGALDTRTIEVHARARYKRRNWVVLMPAELTNTTFELIPAVSILRTDTSELTPTPEARMTVETWDFLFPLLKLEQDIGYQFEQLEAYRWNGFDLGQTLSRSFLDDRFQSGVGWRLQQYTYASRRVSREVAQRINIYDDSGSISQTVAMIQPSLTWEGRDDPVEPTEGIYARVGMDIGFAAGGDSSGFMYLEPELRGYIPLGTNRIVLAGRAMLGTNLSGNLPAPRRVYAGGSASQRGFAQRRLSPVTDLYEQNTQTVDESGQTIPIGGETVVEFNLETRFRLFKLFGFWFGSVVFVDAADLGNRFADLKFPNLHYAAGLGLRYLTPIGAVRLDYGYRLNRQQDTSVETCQAGDLLDCGTFHISLGQAF